MLGEFTWKDQAHTANALASEVGVKEQMELTRSGSLATRWWTSCCRQRAWRPQWRRAQRCLVLESEMNALDENGC
jgi:hypothetical protein